MGPGGDTTRPHHEIHALPGVGAPPTGDTTRRTPPGHVLPLPSPPDAAVEARLGGYRLEGVLGRGGMGVVHLAESIALGRKVALKVLSAHGDPELVERFLIEARAAARIDHPNVVRVHEVGRDGARWFLAMDLVDGESLRARVQRDGPLEPREAARIVEAIGRALHHAHGLGVLHRDVKPHNVLVSRDGTPRLADFGLAKLQGDPTSEGITATGAVLGTPAYMAPEQAQGDPARVDRRTDVYALGATLYEALTGRPPFEGPTAMNILHQVFEAAPIAPSVRRPGLDRDLETICLHALEKDAAARYDTAAAFADDLARWASGEPITARRAGVGERVTKWARRRPLAAIGLVAAAVVASSAAAGLGAARLERRRIVDRVRGEARARVDAIGSIDSQASAQARSERLARASEALEAVRRWVNDAADPEGVTLLGRVATQVGDLARELHQFTTAKQAYSTAAELPGAGQELEASREAAADLEQGHLLRRAGDAIRAREPLQRARARRPRWIEVHLELAEVAHLEGRFDRVDQHLGAALELRDDDTLLLAKRALAQSMLGRAADALTTIERAVALRPELAELWVFCAEKRLAVGDRAGAVEACDEALRRARAPDEEVLALTQRFQSQPLSEQGSRAALADAERLTQLLPDSAEAWARLGMTRRQSGRSVEAEAALARALELDPTYELALLERALIGVPGVYPEAGRYIEEALAARPNDPALLTRRALLRMELDDARGATEDATQALSRLVSLQIAEALVTRAASLRMLGQHQQAEADASAALRLVPTFVDAWLVRGVVRAELGQTSAAVADLERFVKHAPASHQQAAYAREHLQRLRAAPPR